MVVRARRGVGLVAAAALLGGSLLVSAAPASMAASAAAVQDHLPGGTTIEVDITTPPPPNGDSYAPGPVTVAGTASIGADVPPGPSINTGGPPTAGGTADGPPTSTINQVVYGSTLTALTLRVDAGAAIPVTETHVVRNGVTVPATLPLPGPEAVNDVTSVKYMASTPTLAAGQHRICVTATGTDHGGTGNVTACHTITIRQPAPAPTPTISLTIDTPTDGAQRTAGPVAVAGTASIGEGTDLSDAALVYVLDVSGSTDNPGVAGCLDQNGDEENRVLDCEIAAVKDVNDRAVRDGKLAEVGAAVFGETAATADVVPDVRNIRGEQFITGPGSDLDGIGGRDIEQVVASAFSTYGGVGGIDTFTRKEVGPSTNFADGIQKAVTVAEASGKTRKIVAFLSDGVADGGGNIGGPNRPGGPLDDVPPNIQFFTFAVGPAPTTSCDSTGVNNEGSLREIAKATGGTCTHVPDVASLPKVLPGVLTSELTSLTMQVDGGAAIPITDVTPGPLPQPGPVHVSYTATTPALSIGQHTICVTATGNDHAGNVATTQCHTITVNPAEGPPITPTIAVAIDTPADGAERLAGPVAVTGTASIGSSHDLSDAALVYVLDVSGSTRSLGGCGANQNNDDVSNSILDCEIAAVTALNQQAALDGSLTEVGAAVFGGATPEFEKDAATVDVMPDFGDIEGEQFVTGPASDFDGIGGRDIEQALSTAFSTATGVAGIDQFTRKEVGSDTNFADGIRKATTVAGASSKARKIVVFLSDGVATVGGSITEPLAQVPANVDIFTFAVGAGSSCSSTGVNGEGSLQQIADATGGTCTPVADVASLPDILPGVLTTELTELTLSVDGAATIPITDVTPTLPQPGPVTANYLTTTPALAPGQHTLCVTATGHENGLAASATTCHVVTVKPAAERPPSSSIAVTIDTPPDGATMPAGHVAVTGTASIGQGTDLSDTALVYVLDVSSSTRSPGGCGNNPNNDDLSNSILDCEIAAVTALNGQAAGNGRLTEVGAAVFGEAAVTADVGPATGEQLITGPASDVDKTGGRDIDQVLNSVFSTAAGEGGVGTFTRKGVGGNTNFADGIQKATTVAGASGKAHKIVAFLSDGTATAGGSITQPLAAVAPNVDIYTFAVGTFSSCDDTGDNGEGSLQQIANATGGTCTPVTDVTALPNILSGVITTQLTSLTLQVDGAAAIPITQVTPALPHAGPVKVNYTATIPALAPGQHTICVTAIGHEDGRDVSATDCHVITARQAVLAVDPPIGPQGMVVRAVGTDFPPGARIRLAWSVGLSETPGEVTVGADGRFTVQVLVFHKDRLGPRELTATPVSGPPIGAVRSQSFLVVAPALQPPMFQSRR